MKSSVACLHLGNRHNGVSDQVNGEPKLTERADMGSRCRVLLAGDHELVLDMLRNLLEPEFDVVGAATDSAMLLELAQQLGPDIILVDKVVPGVSGLDVGKALQSGGSAAKLVYLTMETDPAVAVQAFRVGASGYISKASPAVELLRAVRRVAAGERYLSPTIVDGDIEKLLAGQSTHPVNCLSRRELEVLKLLVRGMQMKVVAHNLGITARTVAFHKYRAMEQLGLRSNPELIDFAIRHRLLGGEGSAPSART
ncbi:MAG TPA: response regulator transcription factor [Acetobacteraceae bacterium]|jgi:DNA-binding NarL/FixJ family response regulator|nr:response regulator transcription factor [Acetobacteraceae bacterium]